MRQFALWACRRSPKNKPLVCLDVAEQFILGSANTNDLLSVKRRRILDYPVSLMLEIMDHASWMSVCILAQNVVDSICYAAVIAKKTYWADIKCYVQSEQAAELRKLVLWSDVEPYLIQAMSEQVL